MDIEKRLDLIKRPPTEEILTEEELRKLLETKECPIAYGGWEPSGKMHLGTGLICAYKIKDFIKAGIRFKIFLATYHAYLNRKLGGDLEKIRLAAKHFKHGWTALGIDPNKVEYVFADELYEDLGYWSKVLSVAKKLTLARTRRTMQIAGRKETEAKHVSDFLYTPMQVADIFHLKVDIHQLGMDQRNAGVVAREIGESLGYWKPVLVSHHLLAGLTKPTKAGYSRDAKLDLTISSKMSKSKAKTCVFIYDKPKDIKEKLLAAYCPAKRVKNNPLLDWVKYIIFREFSSFEIERPSKYGGNLEYHSYQELVSDFRKGNLHPLDLKKALARELIKILKPVRSYFKQNKEAKKGLETIEKFAITR